MQGLYSVHHTFDTFSGFSGWFPNPDEKRVEPPEASTGQHICSNCLVCSELSHAIEQGQEAMAIQEAEKEEVRAGSGKGMRTDICTRAEEHEEDPMSKASWREARRREMGAREFCMSLFSFQPRLWTELETPWLGMLRRHWRR